MDIKQQNLFDVIDREVGILLQNLGAPKNRRLYRAYDYANRLKAFPEFMLLIG